MRTVPLTGAILAGGALDGQLWAHRALAEIDGETLIDRQIRTMRELCREIIVVTDTPKPFLTTLDHSIRLITDYHTDRGPLGGIHAALYLSRYEHVWIAACSLAHVSAEAARQLWEHQTPEARAVIPILRAKPIPLHGIYDKSCAEAASRQLTLGDKRLSSFLGQFDWQGVPADEWLTESRASCHGMSTSMETSRCQMSQLDSCAELTIITEIKTEEEMACTRKTNHP